MAKTDEKTLVGPLPKPSEEPARNLNTEGSPPPVAPEPTPVTETDAPEVDAVDAPEKPDVTVQLADAFFEALDESGDKIGDTITVNHAAGEFEIEASGDITLTAEEYELIADNPYFEVVSE